MYIPSPNIFPFFLLWGVGTADRGSGCFLPAIAPFAQGLDIAQAQVSLPQRLAPCALEGAPSVSGSEGAIHAESP